jgi:anti-sigma28 factor (negative regulator of flagellin synthesis)
MEEAIVDVALDLNLQPAESTSQEEAQQGMRTDHRDQAQLLATVPQVEQAPSVPSGDEKQQSSCLSTQDQEVSAPFWQGDMSERNEAVESLRPQDRAARVENLRECIANGTYSVDSVELARCILRNATRFVETC